MPAHDVAPLSMHPPRPREQVAGVRQVLRGVLLAFAIIIVLIVGVLMLGSVVLLLL